MERNGQFVLDATRRSFPTDPVRIRTIAAKWFVLLTPLAGALSSRILQLGILLVLSSWSESGRDFLVIGFGLVASLGVMSDSGAANFILSRDRTDLSTGMIFRVIAFHVLLGTCGAAGAVALAVRSGGSEASTYEVCVLAAVAASQVLDSVTRASRSVELLRYRDARYAWPEIALTIMKLPLVVGAYLAGALHYLFGLPLASLIVACVTLLKALLGIARSRSEKSIYRELVTFGISGAVSALYSQSPTVLGSFLLSPNQLAPIVIMYRVVQPVEIVAATMGQQIIPRMRSRMDGCSRYWAIFVIIGFAVGAVAAALGPAAISAVFEESVPYSVFLVLACSIPIKFGNYALVSFLLARRYVLGRLYATLAVGLLGMMAILVMVQTVGPVGLVAVTLFSEAILALALVAVAESRNGRDFREVGEG